MRLFTERFALFVQLLLTDRVEAHLIEEAQQPWLTGGELRVFEEFVPDRQRAPHQLVTARRIHAVDAHVHAADADRPFGGVGARRVIFGAQQAMARIERHRAGRAEVDVPSPRIR